jgi:hypothetical protein
MGQGHETWLIRVKIQSALQFVTLLPQKLHLTNIRWTIIEIKRPAQLEI